MAQVYKCNQCGRVIEYGTPIEVRVTELSGYINNVRYYCCELCVIDGMVDRQVLCPYLINKLEQLTSRLRVTLEESNRRWRERKAEQHGEANAIVPGVPAE